mgnify:CR=1 FL=1
MSLRTFLVASALAAALPLAPAAAQPAPRVGATVTDQNGGTVGTITAVEGDMVIIRTDRHETQLPVTSFTVTDDAVLFGLTQAELNSRIEQALAEAAQAFQVGATVHDRDGAVVGPVEALDAETGTVKFGEQRIRLPRGSVGAAENGLVIGATVAELRAQIAG